MTTLSENGHAAPADVTRLDTTHPAPVPATPADILATADTAAITDTTAPPVRVDQPGGERGDWLADLAENARTRRPIVPPWLRSRREALATLRLGRPPLPACVRLPRRPCPEVRQQARGPRPARCGPARVRGGAVDVRSGRPPGADGRCDQGRPRGVPETVPAAGLPACGCGCGSPGLSRHRRAGRAALAAAGPALARLGRARPGGDRVRRARRPSRPAADRPGRVPARVEKLTSDIVIRALGALGIAAIDQAHGQEPRAGIEFNAPITRDGPGWRADLRPALRRDRRRGDRPPGQAGLRAAPPARLRVARSRPRRAHRPAGAVGR